MSDILAYHNADKCVLSTAQNAYILPLVEKSLADAVAYYKEVCERDGESSISAEMSANHCDTIRAIYNQMADHHATTTKRGA